MLALPDLPPLDQVVVVEGSHRAEGEDQSSISADHATATSSDIKSPAKTNE